MSAGISLPRRKSAQRAGATLRKFAVFQGGSGNKDTDSDDFLGDQLTSESSSDDGSEGVRSSEDDGSADEELSGEEMSVSYSRQAVWDTPAAYSDIMKKNREKYTDKMSFLEAAEIKEVESDEQVNISVNDQKLSAFSSIDSDKISIGYGGGTAVLARWVPNSTLLCLAVCNTSHIVTYKSPLIDSIQLWSYDSNCLTYLYSLKVLSFYDLLVYPYRTEDSSTFTLCVSCKNCAKVVSLPTSKPKNSLHYEVVKPSILLNIGTNDNQAITVTKIQWSLFNDNVNILGGLSSGGIVKWNLSNSLDRLVILPEQKVWAHPGHPISGISVCPQMPHLFCSTAQDSRMRIWNLKNFQKCVFSQTRPQKQLMLPSHIHWSWFWSSILVLSMIPVKKDKAHGNSNIMMMSTAPLRHHSQKIGHFVSPRIFSNELHYIQPRCFDFSDQHSTMVVGFHQGVAALFKVSNLWIMQKTKEKGCKSHNFLYLKSSATPKTGVDVSHEFKDDQDFINHFEFTLPTKPSDSLSSESQTLSDYSRKSLTSVTHVAWQKNDSVGQNVCICYMSGLFQVFKPPKGLFSHPTRS